VCLSPADYADYAEKECSKAVLFRREIQFVVNVVLGFRLRLSAGSAGDTVVSFGAI
jgi:hypothetical protein